MERSVNVLPADGAVARIRAATKSAHVATERRAFSQSLVRGQLTLSQYVQHLEAYRLLWTDLERTMASPVGELGRTIWRADERSRLALLQEDLAEHGSTGPTDVLRNIAFWDQSMPVTPAAVLGRLYVLEGSSLGGAILGPILAKSLGLSTESMRYYNPYGNSLTKQWGSFVAAIELALSGPGQTEQAIEGALGTFAVVGDALDACLTASS